MLFKYVTTVYSMNSSLAMRLIKLLISKEDAKRAETRKNPDLVDSDVRLFCRWRGFLELALLRVKKLRIFYYHFRNGTIGEFGRRVARFAIKNNVDAVIMYDTTAYQCFRILARRAPQIRRILDISAASRPFMLEIYKSDSYRSPDFARTLGKEIPYLHDRKISKAYQEELLLSEVFLAPSEFVRSTLVRSGITSRRIELVPYGVDIKQFEFTDRICKSAQDRLEFVYVGGTKQFKGLSYLLEAFSRISPEEANLTIVGTVDWELELLQRCSSNIRFIGSRPHDEMPEILSMMDVLILPSLGEGMSLSAMEAMACGLPVIVTNNSGLDGLVQDQVNGFMIPIQDPDTIQEKILWFLEHREWIPAMGKAARASIESRSWDAYYVDAVQSIKRFMSADPEDSIFP